jgi:hypothetical protein
MVLLRLILMAGVLCLSGCHSSDDEHVQAELSDVRYTTLLKEMFTEMVEQKKANLIPYYYHRDLMVYTNGKEYDYKSFLKMHQDIYETPIQYEIAYNDETFVEDGDKVAGIVYITTSRPDEEPKEIEVILIIRYKENKIYRVWELTWPDWSKLPAFESELPS